MIEPNVYYISLKHNTSREKCKTRVFSYLICITEEYFCKYKLIKLLCQCFVGCGTSCSVNIPKPNITNTPNKYPAVTQANRLHSNSLASGISVGH